MRLVRLLVVATLVLVAGRTAAGQSQRQNNSPSSSRHNQARTIAPAKDFSRGTQSWTAPVDRDSLCMTMHTIRVAREDGTDATHVIGESTCTPAFRLEMKSVVSNSAAQK